jgi:hypothetical protein
MLGINALKLYYNDLNLVRRLFFPPALKAGINREDISPLELFKLANTRAFRAFVLMDPNFNFFDLPRIQLCQFLQTKGLLDPEQANTYFVCIQKINTTSHVYDVLKILDKAGFLIGKAGQALCHAVLTHTQPDLAINALSEGLFYGEKNQVLAQLRIIAHYPQPEIAALALIILFSKTQFDMAWSIVAQLNHQNWLIPRMTQADLHVITSSISIQGLDHVSIHESRAEESSFSTTFSGAMNGPPPAPTPKHRYNFFNNAPILPAPPQETEHLAYFDPNTH